MSEVLVQIEAVVKRFGDFTAVRRMDLDIQRGEFLALMGSSGCGKTTTLRMLAGLDQPSEGVIRLEGRVMNGVPASARDTPMVWQSLALFPFLNVRENVEFGLKMRGVDTGTRRHRANDWLERLAIGEFAERDVALLSGGQRQRVALARALVTEPQILLLDEPLSALDANLVVRMQGVLTRLHRELGITFVYVTHSQSEAFAMANRVVIMDSGAIAQIGAPQDIYRAPANRFVAEFVGSNNILTGQRGDGSAVSTALGEFVLDAAAGPDEASEVSFVVSADRVQLSKTEPEAVNKVACQLISEEFVGSVVTLFLEAPDGSELKAEIQQRELERISPEPGMRLWASWDAAHVHVLPRSA